MNSLIMCSGICCLLLDPISPVLVQGKKLGTASFESTIKDLIVKMSLEKVGFIL